MSDLLIDGYTLSIEDIVQVARERRRVRVHPKAAAQVQRCRALVDVLLAHDVKVYGLTTGFGKLRDVVIARQDSVRLQENLLRSHAAGVGIPFAEDTVRAAILLRANTLMRGNSGVRLELIQTVLDLLNDDIYPYIPQQGSVGASGDLAPLSHLGLVLMGDPQGRVFGGLNALGEREMVTHPREDDFVPLGETATQDAEAAGLTFRPIVLQAKEGLGINNGTQFMTGLGALLVHDTHQTLRWTELACALSLEANRGIRGAFDPRIHQARPQSHQEDCARRIISYCAGSQILDFYLNSARVNRALNHLDRASQHLSNAASHAAVEGIQLDSVARAQGAIQALQDRVKALLPTDSNGDSDAKGIRDFSAMAPEDQIPKLQQRTRRARQELGSLLQTLTSATFFRDRSVELAESSLVMARSELTKAVPDAPIVQDDYSTRCFPQVLACGYRALDHVREVITVEANAATDNPLLFPPEPPGGFDAMDPQAYKAWLSETPERIKACRSAVIGGGNFHGEPVAVAMDYLTLCVAEVGNISERRIAHLVDDNHSRGLPPFLVQGSGLNSGWMIPQYTAASLVSENKVLCHPASADSVPTCGNTEDHVSMGTIAARQCKQVLTNVREIVGIEVLSATQGLIFRQPLLPGLPLQAVVDQLRAKGIEPLLEDRVMYPDMRRMQELMRDSELLQALAE